MLQLKLMILLKKIKKLKKFLLNKTGLILTMSLLLQELNTTLLMANTSSHGLISGLNMVDLLQQIPNVMPTNLSNASFKLS
jgi:hypothetical protein